MQEREIIEGCRLKNHKAQRAFVDTYSRYLYSICRRYINVESQAKDCLQEAMLHILTHMDSYKEQGKFKAWIARITVLKCLQGIRKEKKHISFEIQESYQEKGATRADYILESQDVLRFLNELSPKYRIAINMYLIEGYSHKEIAEVLQVKEGTSRALVSRGRKMINDKFEEDRLRVVHNTRGKPTTTKLKIGF